MPKTPLGRWSVYFVIGFFALFALFNVIVPIQGRREDQTFFSNPALSIPILLAGLCGIASFFSGLVAIIKQKERSPFVFISTIIGLMVLWFVVGEIALPH